MKASCFQQNIKRDFYEFRFQKYSKTNKTFNCKFSLKLKISIWVKKKFL